MNIVDYAIIAVVGVSLLFGLYKGFIRSVLSLAGIFVALFVAYTFSPRLVEWISNNPTLLNTLLYYTDASSRLGDLELAQSLVTGLNPNTIAEIVSRTGLPAPFDAVLQSNMLNQVYAMLPQATVSEYLNQTVISIVIHIVSFVTIFFGAYAALTLLTNLLHYVFRFPVLKQFDLLLGGAFGVARGVFLVYVLFSIVPILMTVVPFPQLAEAVEQSQLGPLLLHSRLIQTIMQGHL